MEIWSLTMTLALACNATDCTMAHLLDTHTLIVQLPSLTTMTT